ncbi:ECF transporter S component [Sporolactobacillus shoreae]|uniref:ECF transporter S component n=1 Tax=Sporolactobacillus shoreae TaxID=1465501 RepID=A0A4Z0GJQ9_9BACL|nr:CD3073 family putative ECF transporter S component [Sporolactobacillus shoreae]TGA96133.1 ECF transporter S component [Sporolactobacillus shoreae]
MNKKTLIITLSALAIAINVVAGTVVGNLKIPFLFLDALGTIFIAASFGPYWGASVGIVTNLVLGVTNGYTEIPFAIVNGVIGLIVGLLATKKGYTLKIAVLSGIIVGFVAPVIGTIIAVFLFGGLTGGGQDAFVLFFKQTGASLFTSAFIPRLIDNIIDKNISAILVYFVIRSIPASILGKPEKTAQTIATAGENKING